MIFGKFEAFLIENYNFSMNITERDRNLLENLIFSVFFIIFMKTVNFQAKIPDGSAFHWKI